MKRVALLIVGLVLLGAAAAYGYSWWTTKRFVESTDDAYVGGDITVMAPRVSGFIAAVLVQDNQRVHAGDVLVRLDDRDQRAKLARAEAAVLARQATVANLDANRVLQQPIIAQARAESDAAAAESERAQLDVERYRALSTEHSAPIQRLEQAEADRRKAVAGNDHARATVDVSQRQLRVIDTQKAAATAALAQAVAERQLAQLELEYTVLRAPIDGVVGNRSARVGGYVVAGSPLVSLVPSRGLWVDANFKESQLARMRPGQRVDVIADVLPGERFVGHVVSLAPATGSEFSVLPAQNATGNFTKIVQRVPVRIELDGDAGELGPLRPGLSVTADVRTDGVEPKLAAR